MSIEPFGYQRERHHLPEQDRNEAFARVFEDFLDGLEKAYVVRVQ